MITTVTMNPAIDKLYRVQNYTPHTVMRVGEVRNSAGGKGINVARVSALLGEETAALGILGGFNGQYIRSALQGMNIRTDFVEGPGETRCCINIWDLATSQSTEFLEPGSAVEPATLEALLQSYRRALGYSDVIAISGSAPEGTPANFYAKLVELAREAGIPVLLDSSGETLQLGTAACPTLVKPNDTELCQLLGVACVADGDVADAAMELHRTGIPYVAVSRGKDGVLVACAEGLLHGITPDLPIVNTVGCGDSMLAGFATGLRRGYDVERTIHLAVAVSTANALSVSTGHFEQQVLEDLMGQVRVKRLA